MSEIKRGFGYAQTQVMGKDEWLTPPELITSLGEFDLDPCAPLNRPWDTAKKHYTILDDGLKQSWEGRVWLNPPYGDFVWTWLKKLEAHKNGLALIFARTGTPNFHNTVFDRAHGVLFIRGRLHFHHVTGIRAKHNAGADSCLVSYNQRDTDIMFKSEVKGKRILLENC